ncbi:Uncharacterised protein [Kluyvera cryocrescens]|uniref:Uncharacterized protein n=1 Tax=Kluyvera cryocrescens TaxID=580 RepID=A0A485AQB7_KLUCR|nr:Uncharacterised protein [Kluyvera cryocrescens]
MVFIFYRGEVVTLVKFTEVDFATGLGIPQAQRIGGIGIISRDNLVVSNREDLFRLQPAAGFPFHLHASAKTHFVTGIVTRELPRVTVLQPVVRGLFLSPIDDILFKHAVVIADTVTTARQRQGSQRVKEAGRQTP